MLNRFITYFFIISVLLHTACTSTKQLSTQNLVYLYKTTTELKPEFIIYHLNATHSRIYFRVPKKEISFQKKSIDDDEQARLRVSAKLLYGYDNEMAIDTASAFYTKFNSDVINIKGIEFIYDSLDIRIQSGNNYLLHIMFAELNQSKFYTINIGIEKSSINNRQQFKITDENNLPIFNYILKKDDIVNIQHYKNVNHFYVRYYKREFPIAAPAFVTTSFQPFNYKADSVFSLELINNQTQFTPLNEGFYHIQLDTINDKEGLTFFVFGKYFPEISTPENMLEPLRFITSREEYDNIQMAENVKLHVEKFWLNAGGSPDRAKELIKKYYGRVYQANLYFTSYKEGWKTDRGMIFLIFGLPNVINRTNSSEVWIYGEENNMMSLNFTFYKVTNPFTANDYILDRSIIYKNIWYRGVESWRQGRIY
jgi:GWxTD domain-containing protein